MFAACYFTILMEYGHVLRGDKKYDFVFGKEHNFSGDTTVIVIGVSLFQQATRPRRKKAPATDMVGIPRKGEDVCSMKVVIVPSLGYGCTYRVGVWQEDPFAHVGAGRCPPKTKQCSIPTLYGSSG